MVSAMNRKHIGLLVVLLGAGSGWQVLAEYPPYAQHLLALRANRDVLPPAPTVHPVVALYSREAIIPPQCYTRTEGKFNPCYVCHQDAIPGRENRMNDGNLQSAYSFSDIGLTNHWSNLFEDRSARVAAISDAQILDWIDDDNYSALAPRLREADFRGYIPDLTDLQEGADAFDGDGFAKDGSGWVAFNYKPMPSTFWPTNGSTDDVMIRLPLAFRNDASGRASTDIYRANLAILEARIKGLTHINVAPLDEVTLEFDINDDGELSVAHEVNRITSFVGAAKGYFSAIHIYPLGTEFLHTVRYVGVNDDGEIHNARRMKEVRYMRKHFILPHQALAQSYREEGYAKDQGYLPGYINRGQQGLDNGMGWVLQGFIEGADGQLRANTFEETMFCMGCHTSIGTTIDKTFSFPRKIDGAAGWGYIDLRGMVDAPSMGETRGEIATYLARVGGGGEFRSNAEMAQRWMRPDGAVDLQRTARADVYTLITPSRERALLLNKAYRTIVADQDYLFGRDATITPPTQVYSEVDPGTAPTLPADAQYRWDIRLDWPQASRATAIDTKGSPIVHRSVMDASDTPATSPVAGNSPRSNSSAPTK